mmetsp:Transcript_48120/g.127411  ORF Transcript_48120/g.127411 Transcript_48120/m.127411 type:complete len:108 (-) Transcript_48120:98-421(-)
MWRHANASLQRGVRLQPVQFRTAPCHRAIARAMFGVHFLECHSRAQFAVRTVWWCPGRSQYTSRIGGGVVGLTWSAIRSSMALMQAIRVSKGVIGLEQVVTFLVEVL